MLSAEILRVTRLGINSQRTDTASAMGACNPAQRVDPTHPPQPTPRRGCWDCCQVLCLLACGSLSSSGVKQSGQLGFPRETLTLGEWGRSLDTDHGL